MTPEQARLLVAVLHRLNAPQDAITRAIIDDFSNAVGAYADLGVSSDADVGSPDIGTPILTVYTE